jgi:hypothetical protein
LTGRRPSVTGMSGTCNARQRGGEPAALSFPASPHFFCTSCKSLR